MSITKAKRLARELQKAIDKGLGHHALRQRGQRLVDSVRELQDDPNLPRYVGPLRSSVDMRKEGRI